MEYKTEVKHESTINPEDVQLKSLEQQVVENTKEESIEDQAEKSAATFYHMHQNFKRIGYQLAERKKKSPIRILEAFLFEPLHEVKVYGKEEQLLLDMARELMYHKNKIMEYGLQKLQKEKEETNGKN